MTVKAYLRNVWIALDQLGNALFAGNPQETISSRCGRALLTQQRCVLCSLVCRLLNVFWPDHCIHNIEKSQVTSASNTEGNP